MNGSCPTTTISLGDAATHAASDDIVASVATARWTLTTLSSGRVSAEKPNRGSLTGTLTCTGPLAGDTMSDKASLTRRLQNHWAVASAASGRVTECRTMPAKAPVCTIVCPCSWPIMACGLSAEITSRGISL